MMTYALAAAFVTANTSLVCPAEAPAIHRYPPAIMTAVYGNRYGVTSAERAEIVLATDTDKMPWVLVHEVAHWCGADEPGAQAIHHLWMRQHGIKGASS